MIIWANYFRVKVLIIEIITNDINLQLDDISEKTELIWLIQYGIYGILRIFPITCPTNIGNAIRTDDIDIIIMYTIFANNLSHNIQRYSWLAVLHLFHSAEWKRPLGGKWISHRVKII